MSWWKKQLAATSADTESVKALADSKEALNKVEALRPQVDELSSSLGQENTLNHFSKRLAVAYGLPPGEHS